MKIAVIGAGLAGLATAYYLLEHQDCQVTLFDAKGVGGGASGASTGLVHPYAGEDMRGSWRAHAALEETKRLLDALDAPYTKGILRYAKKAPDFPDIGCCSCGSCADDPWQVTTLGPDGKCAGFRTDCVHGAHPFCDTIALFSFC